MLYGVVLGIHILVSLALIVTVLLQSGKGGGLAGAFGGGGGAGAVFGGQTAATFLTKATRYLAVVFMITSLSLAFVIRARNVEPVMGGMGQQAPTSGSAASEVDQQENPVTGMQLPGGAEDAGAPPAATENPVATEESGD